MNKNTLTILFFGDVIGKIARQALQLALPQLKKKYAPDLVIANVENLAHGKSITEKTWNDLVTAGVDFGTSGNHIFKKPEGKVMLDGDFPIIRPANYPEGTEGVGYKIVKTDKGEVLIVNLLGQVFIDDEPLPTNPFLELEKILAENKKIKNIIVDVHAEATSEKVAMGLMFDGRVSAVVGTHTHVATADEQILPKGTGYITDIGMVGAKYSIIGGEKEPIFQAFREEITKAVFEIPDKGLCQINAVLIQIDTKTGLTKKIIRLDDTVEV